MTTKKVQVELPLSIYEQLTEIAGAAAKPLADVIVQCIRGGMPPTLHKVPEAFHQELLALNRLDDKQLLQISEGALPTRSKLDDLHKKADFETLRRIYALSLLRWRGHPVPTPYETLMK